MASAQAGQVQMVHALLLMPSTIGSPVVALLSSTRKRPYWVRSLGYALLSCRAAHHQHSFIGCGSRHKGYVCWHELAAHLIGELKAQMFQNLLELLHLRIFHAVVTRDLPTLCNCLLLVNVYLPQTKWATNRMFSNRAHKGM